MRNSLLTAQAAQADSLWVPDHLNSLFPRSVMKKPYVGAAPLMPRPDASLEPWTMLGHIATKNRLAAVETGLGGHRHGPTQPGGHRSGGGDVASAVEGPRDPRHRNRRARRQRAVRGRLVEAGRAASSRRSRRSGPCGIPTASPSLATRNSSRCTTPPSTFRRTRGNGPRSGSPRTVRACCGPPGATPTHGSPAAIFHRPDYKACLDVVRSAASDAGRDPTSVRAANFFYVVTGRSRDEVDEALDSTSP